MVLEISTSTHLSLAIVFSSPL